MKRSLRITKQRKIIIEELGKTQSHPTAAEIYEAVRKRLPKISLGTVYRNLEFLSEIGVIQKLEMAGAQMRFDRTTSNHYHIRCVICRRVDDAPMKPSNSIDPALSENSGYSILRHKIEFMGICPNCKASGGQSIFDIASESTKA